MSPRSSPAPQQSVMRRLTRRYILALSTIALLSILGQVAVQITLSQSSRDANIINIAALQRTLSEPLSKYALAILVAPNPAAQDPYGQGFLASVAPRVPPRQRLP